MRRRALDLSRRSQGTEPLRQVARKAAKARMEKVEFFMVVEGLGRVVEREEWDGVNGLYVEY